VLPVDFFGTNESVQKIQLRGSRCGDDAGAFAIANGAANGVCGLFGSSGAERKLVLEYR